MLAIVIPVYKKDFLEACLESIATQTCSDFRLYIGDDASPFDVEAVVRPYRSRIDLVYCRFSENLGGKDLISQWERCIDLTQDEEWIWLFSDDDLMAPDCIEAFYREMHDVDSDLLRFNVEIIDGKSNSVARSAFPRVLAAQDFVRKNLEGKIQSFAVEYIFRRSAYVNCCGFVRFDMAWGSDFATWATMAKGKGIVTLNGGCVFWRRSLVNISQSNDRVTLLRKISAIGDYCAWADTFLGGNERVLVNKRYLDQIQSGWRVLGFADAIKFVIKHGFRMKAPFFMAFNFVYILLYFAWKKAGHGRN